jgi:hypothetical protein
MAQSSANSDAGRNASPGNNITSHGDINITSHGNINITSRATVDVEKAMYQEGLAGFLASTHDKSALIFRRYDRLALLNILALEERLKALEEDTKKAEKTLPSRLSKELEEAIHAYRKSLISKCLGEANKPA